MGQHLTPMTWLFLVATWAIAIGYFSIPFLVLRYLPLTRPLVWWGAGFFGLCSLTFATLGLFIRKDVGVFWTFEFVAQAVCTWMFIIGFHRMLRAATAQRRHMTGGGGEDQ